MPELRNTILKLQQLDNAPAEYLCLVNGFYTFTDSRDIATPLTESEVQTAIDLYQNVYQIKLQREAWIILNARYEPAHEHKRPAPKKNYLRTRELQAAHGYEDRIGGIGFTGHCQEPLVL